MKWYKNTFMSMLISNSKYKIIALNVQMSRIFLSFIFVKNYFWKWENLFPAGDETEPNSASISPAFINGKNILDTCLEKYLQQEKTCFRSLEQSSRQFVHKLSWRCWNFWLVSTDHMTIILASDWPPMITWL